MRAEPALSVPPGLGELDPKWVNIKGGLEREYLLLRGLEDNYLYPVSGIAVLCCSYSAHC
jgi:hypothetical protein